MLQLSPVQINNLYVVTIYNCDVMFVRLFVCPFVCLSVRGGGGGGGGGAGGGGGVRGGWGEIFQCGGLSCVAAGSQVSFGTDDIFSQC